MATKATASTRGRQVPAQDWRFVVRVTAPALDAAPRSFLDDLRAHMAAEGMQDAVANHNTGAIFDWLQ